MNTEITYTQFILFCKVHRESLLENIHAYVEIQKAPSLLLIEQDFLHYFADRKLESLQDDFIDDINLWLQTERNTLSLSELPSFRYIFEQAFLTFLIKLKSPQSISFSLFISELFVTLSSLYLKFHHQGQLETKKTINVEHLIRLNKFSTYLIEAGDPSVLPTILKKAEEIFQFKRCVFYAYNPWMNEFYGVYGAELKKVQSVRDQLSEAHSIFSSRKTVFLKDPSSHMSQVAIDLFKIASILFTPIFDSQSQLYGWLTFDQMNEAFDLTKEDLDLLERAGELFGLFLSRKTSIQKTTYLDLTEREKVVLHLLADGHNNKEMASLLFLSEHTVRDYVQRLMEKLQAKNRTQVVSNAFRIGLLK